MRRIAVITGSSKGIGTAVVEEFLGAGYAVFGLARSENTGPNGATFIRTDISDEHQVSWAIEKVSAEADRIDALVNNAAVQLNARLVETTPEQWDRVMAVNLRGMFLVTRAAYPLLKRSGNAGIVNVSSVHAMGTSEGIAAYAASKGGVVALTRAAALEMAEDGIRVNCVLPGAVDTPMLREGFSRGHLKGERVEEQMAQLAARTPLGLIGSPREIARAIVFLASPETASFVTGQTLVVDGGALARLSTE
ncbi:SDR family NAD(P)-dependent oxidoreductase [Thermodesulfobacteriota bacterium]